MTRSASLRSKVNRCEFYRTSETARSRLCGGSQLSLPSARLRPPELAAFVECLRRLILLRDSGRRLGSSARSCSGSGFVQDPVVDGEERQFQTVGDADLVVHVAQVIFYNLLGGSQLRRDFFVLVALHDQGNDP